MSIKVGIICPSEIAFRRFMPSLKRLKEFSFAGVAIATPEEWSGNAEVTDKILSIIDNERAKAQKFVDAYGGRIIEGYKNLIESEDIDVVYLPLPPALHYKWAKYAVEHNKNVFVEKPFTISLNDTKSLIEIAEKNNLAVHENYMFVFHNQLKAINEYIESGKIGKVRQYRISFGFPRRAAQDFRYNKKLGGGALFDAGGYCLKYASYLLGNTARIVSSNSFYEDEFEVDIFGSATLKNDEGVIVQISFGMDNDYKCELEAWGSTGTLTTGRVLTAPDGLEPTMQVKHNQEIETIQLPADYAFEKSLSRFYDCICNEEIRFENYKIIEYQSQLVDQFIKTREHAE